MAKRKSFEELFKDKLPVSLEELFQTCGLAEKQQPKRMHKWKAV